MIRAPDKKFETIGELVNQLDNLRTGGGDIQSITKTDEKDTFQVHWVDGGNHIEARFTLPSNVAELLDAALTAGLISAQAVNDGMLQDLLLQMSAQRTRSGDLHDDLKVERGSGRGTSV